jgi:hypothetical protein
LRIETFLLNQGGNGNGRIPGMINNEQGYNQGQERKESAGF